VSPNTDGNFRPNDTVTRAEIALVLARLLFADTLPAPTEGQAWYEPAMLALHRESFIMRVITNPGDEVLLGHALNMMRRIDLGGIFQDTKNARKRENRAPAR